MGSYPAQDGVEDDEPQRGGADQQGGDAGGDALLGPHHPAVAAQQQEQPDDRGRAPVRAGWGPGRRCKRRQTYSTPPEIRKRTEAIRKGGMLSTAKRMPR